MGQCTDHEEFPANEENEDIDEPEQDYDPYFDDY
jgi:hypothetical protein